MLGFSADRERALSQPNPSPNPNPTAGLGSPTRGRLIHRTFWKILKNVLVQIISEIEMRLAVYLYDV